MGLDTRRETHNKAHKSQCALFYWKGVGGTDFKMLQSGLLVPEYITKKPKRPTCFDFFCGAGGMGCGMVSAGFEIVGANEFDEHASLTYLVNLGHYPMQIHYIGGEHDKARLNKAVAETWGINKKSEYEGELTPELLKKIFGDEIRQSKPFAGSGWISKTNNPGVRNFWFGDIRKLKGRDILNALGMKVGELDAVCGGPPCQGYSRAGEQKIDDPRNGLVYEYARMIVELQPKTFVMEEVPDIVDFFDPDGVPVLDKFCLILQNGGYGKWEMLKKSLLMQAGRAAGIKGMAKGNEKVKQTKHTAAKQEQEVSAQEQLSLF
jgi:DNA (cytosine-5)-methyltransferase 1